MWVLFSVPCPTPDGQTARDLYEKRLTWITDDMRASARELGCRFHRACYAQDGSAFYALANWGSLDDAQILRPVGHPGRARRGRDHPAGRRGSRAGSLTGRIRPWPVARSNAPARRNTPASSPRGPTIWSPTGSPSPVHPHGTEIAGPASTVIVQHDAIQSRYVVIGSPATSVGYSTSIGNGGTCDTGCTR